MSDDEETELTLDFGDSRSNDIHVTSGGRNLLQDIYILNADEE
jgi:hypothetical protein